MAIIILSDAQEDLLRIQEHMFAGEFGDHLYSSAEMCRLLHKECNMATYFALEPFLVEVREVIALCEALDGADSVVTR